VLGEYYGTPIPDPPEGADVVLEIDVEGARQVLERAPNVVTILLLAPSREAQEERLRARGDSEAHVKRRLELGEREVELGKTLADVVVVNDDLETTLAELRAIIEASRAGRLAP
jgi:guanylate kinase